MNLENLSFSVHTTNLLFRKGLKTTEDLVPVLSSPEKREELRNYLGERGYQEVIDEMPIEDDITDWDITDLPDLPDLPEQEVSVLSADYTKAEKLNQHIKTHAELMQENLYEVCKGLKEMRDNKLYKQLNYQNFEEYCEKEVGIKRRQAYNYISVAENLPEDFVQSTAQIGREKLFLLAKLDEPQREEIQQNTDLNQASVKELKNQIAQLKDEKNKQKNELEKVSQERDEKEQARKILAEGYVKLVHQIEELKKKPPETVTVEDTSRIEELENQIQELKSKLSDAEQKLAEKPMVQERLPEEEDRWRVAEAEFKARLKVLESSFSSLTAFIVGKQKQHVDMSLKIGAVQRTSQKYFDIMKEGEN